MGKELVKLIYKPNRSKAGHGRMIARGANPDGSVTVSARAVDALLKTGQFIRPEEPKPKQEEGAQVDVKPTAQTKTKKEA